MIIIVQLNKKMDINNEHFLFYFQLKIPQN